MEINGPTSRLLPNELEDSNQVNNYGIFKVHEIKQSRTVIPIIILMFIYIILLVATLPLHYYCTAKSCTHSPSSIAVYCNMATWILTLIFYQYFDASNEKMWKFGYGVFFHSVVTIVRIPFLVFSLGNGMLLLYVTFLKDINYLVDKFDTIHYAGIQIIIGIQTISALVFLLIYIARTMEFNASKRMPDVFDEMCHIQEDPNETHQITGNKNRTLAERTLELQADEIYYLKNRCRTLTKAVYQLSVQLESRHLEDDDILLQA